MQRNKINNKKRIVGVALLLIPTHVLFDFVKGGLVCHVSVC